MKKIPNKDLKLLNKLQKAHVILTKHWYLYSSLIILVIFFILVTHSASSSFLILPYNQILPFSLSLFPCKQYYMFTATLSLR